MSPLDTIHQLALAVREHAPGVTLEVDVDSFRHQRELHIRHNVENRLVGVTDEMMAQNPGHAEMLVADQTRVAIERMRTQAIENLGIEPIIQARIDAAVKVETDKRAKLLRDLEAAEADVREERDRDQPDSERLQLSGELFGLRTAKRLLGALDGS